MSEVMPMQIRARGNAFATGIGNWLVSDSMLHELVAHDTNYD